MSKNKCINVEVTKREDKNEDESKLIRRFMKKVQRSKVIMDFVDSTRFKKKSEIQKEEKRRAIKREKKRVLKKQLQIKEDK